MALPVIGAAFLGVLFTRVVAAIVGLLAFKILIRATLLGLFYAAYSLVTSELNDLQATLDIASTNPMIVKALMILPSNTNYIIGLIVSAHITRAVFDIGRHVIGIQKV